MKKTSMLRGIAAAFALTVSSSVGFGQLLFTQYYEGTSVNKWLELTNVGSAAISLGDFSLSIYSNGARENWKSGTASTSTVMALSGTLDAGASLLIYNSGATLPEYALSFGNKLTNNIIANFNGDDSVVLWNDAAAFSIGQIVDAISFSANTGPDVSFVRTSSSIGYGLTVGSSIGNFSSVWSSATLAAVAAAGVTDEARLGYSSVSAVPEPSSYAVIIGVIALAGVATRRRRN